MRIIALAASVTLLSLSNLNPAHAAPSDERLERLRQAEVVIVRGSADHMEQVMSRTNLQYVAIDPSELPLVPLHGQQVLMVNCTGTMSAAARERVRRFVTAGGLLYTTDHAVHFLLEPLFPGYIRFKGRTSSEEIFPMETTGDQGLLAKLATGTHPRWQLAGGGYLFEVVDQHKVDVLMRSKQVGARYGSSVLGVRFRVGDGQVVHVTGHFFTQPGQQPEVAAAGRAFEQLSANVVAEKRRENARLDELYDTAPRRPVTLRSAPSASAAPVATPAELAAPAAIEGKPRKGISATAQTRVRVLERQGDSVRIRDTEGNEGWIDSDAL
jgi:hypothetical protein